MIFSFFDLNYVVVGGRRFAKRPQVRHRAMSLAVLFYQRGRGIFCRKRSAVKNKVK